MVQAEMIGSAEDREIVESVIASVTIDVMDFFLRSQEPAKDLLGDEAMFQDIAIRLLRVGMIRLIDQPVAAHAADHTAPPLPIARAAVHVAFLEFRDAAVVMVPLNLDRLPAAAGTTVFPLMSRDPILHRTAHDDFLSMAANRVKRRCC